MATTYTTNYNLGKQENHADKFDMDVITDNADKIDAALAGLQSGIDGKQAALSPEQLAAVNSGVTSTDVAQIGLNKNNIVSINARYSDNANVQTDIDNLNKSGIYAVNNTTTFTEAVPYQYGTLFHMEIVWWRMQVMFFASASYNKPIFRMSNTNTGGGAASVWNKWHYFDGTLVNP